MNNFFSSFFSRFSASSSEKSTPASFSPASQPKVVAFSDDEQMAMMQCFWQLFQAQPSDADSLFVENTITLNWNAKSVNSNLTPQEKAVLTLSLLGQKLHPWVICAVQLEPYQAFTQVSSFSEEKKTEFKNLVMKIVCNGANKMYKASMAISLFDNTGIDYEDSDFA